MSSILSEISKKVTVKDIKSLGFCKLGWGAPKKVERKIVNGFGKVKAIWDKNQHFWEYYERSDDGDYNGLIYYFPDNFEGYVTSFQGNFKDPKDPKGYALIIVESAYDTCEKFEQILKIEYVDDLELAKIILKRTIKELENEK